MTEASTSRQRKIPVEASDVLLRQFVGYNMKRIYMQIQDDMASSLEPLGLRIGTFSALAVLVSGQGISQTQLSQVLNIKRSGVVIVVDELESAGAIERTPVPGDRRAYSLKVTKAGMRLWEQAERIVQDHETALFAQLNPADLRNLHELLNRAAQSARGSKTETEG